MRRHRTCNPVKASGSSLSSNKNLMYFSFLSFSSTETSWSWPFSVPRIISLVEAVRGHQIQKILIKHPERWHAKFKMICEHLYFTFCNMLLIPGNSIHDKAFQFAQNTRLSPLCMCVKRIRSSTTNYSSNTMTTSGINKNPVDWLLPRSPSRKINIYQLIPKIQ